MTRTTRFADIRKASSIACGKNEPMVILPTDGRVSLHDLPYVDIWDLDHSVRQWDLIAVHEEHDTDYDQELTYLRAGRWYARCYSDDWYIVLEFEARGADRCREICGCHNERGS